VNNFYRRFKLCLVGAFFCFVFVPLSHFLFNLFEIELVFRSERAAGSVFRWPLGRWNSRSSRATPYVGDPEIV
jgi:hypothetical protein